MKLHFISLGCDKNMSDSEHMLYLLERDGFQITDDETEADVIVINTCCFIRDALEESIDTVLEMAPLKESANLKSLVITGCMAERYADLIREELPEVDVVLGTASYDDIVDAIHKSMNQDFVMVQKPLDYLPDDSAGRLVTTGGHFAYLKIAEGCNKHCTYCSIPSFRGNYRSVPMDQLLREARQLVSEGVRELILVAQETTLYGIDLYGKKSLPKLLDELEQIPELRWIRLLYCYPEEIDMELISAMKRNSKVLPYVDMPIQHCSDSILKRMGRLTSKADIIEKIQLLRRELPGMVIRSTVICGFPGETEEMHQELLSFMREMKIDRLGAFTYSREENTPAADFIDQIDEEVANRYLAEVMEEQQRIAFSMNESLIDQEFDCMIEGRIPEDDVYVARTYRDAPNVDSLIFLSNAIREYMTGDFVRVRVTGSNEYDLIGDIIE